MITVKREGNFIGANLVANAKGTLLLSVAKQSVFNIKALMGTSDAYILSYAYTELKLAGKTTPKMRRYAGKAYNQPLILSGEMYRNIRYWPGNGLDSVVVGVDPRAGYAKDGDDYAARMLSVSRLFIRALRLHGEYGTEDIRITADNAMLRASAGRKR